MRGLLYNHCPIDRNYDQRSCSRCLRRQRSTARQYSDGKHQVSDDPYHRGFPISRWKPFIQYVRKTSGYFLPLPPSLLYARPTRATRPPPPPVRIPCSCNVGDVHKLTWVRWSISALDTTQSQYVHNDLDPPPPLYAHLLSPFPPPFVRTY